MSEQSWKPLFRTPASTVTKVLRSSAFVASRERSRALMDDAAGLRELADVVETLDYENAPLSAIADRVAAAVRFLRATAERLETDPGPDGGSAPRQQPTAAEPAAAAGATRERLIVAALHYLVTPVDLVPDFRAGGYIDDVLLLSWVFGAAVTQLEPYLVDEPDA